MNTSIKPELDRLMSWTFAGVLVLLSLISFPQITSHTEAQQAIEKQQPQSQPAAVAAVINYFASTTIQAKAAYVFDIKDQKVLFKKDEITSLPLASLTKIMTAVTAAQTASSTATIMVNNESLAQDGDSGLYGNEQWSLKDLLSYTLVVSSNDGAHAIAAALGGTNNSVEANVDAFISTMNTNAQTLGLSRTRFYNPTGLDLDATHAGAYGSAQDVAKLLAYAVNSYPNIIDATSKPSITVTSLSGFTHSAPNTDVLATQIRGLIAGKTGYTELAGGNLAIVANVNTDHPVVVVVLGSSYEGRFDDVSKLLKAASKSIANNK